MKNIKMTFSSVILILSIISGSAYTYELIDLGPGTAYSINDNGQIVGVSGSHACFFDNSGGGANRDLGALGGTLSRAYSINNNGKIAGSAENGFHSERACLFDPADSGNNKDLGTLETDPLGSSCAYSINNNNQIVGWASDGTNFHRACLFDNASSINNRDLGTLGFPSLSASVAYSINNSGQIAGGAGNHGCLFDAAGGGANTDLGALGGATSSARAINDNGLIVGEASITTFPPISHAVLFGPARANTDLGTTAGLDESFACSINNQNQIVGYASYIDILHSIMTFHAVLFDPSGLGNNTDLNILLNDPLWTLNRAYCINNNGWIVGSMTNSDGAAHAFLLIPEPATLLLFAFGGLAVLRKRGKLQ